MGESRGETVEVTSPFGTVFQGSKRGREGSKKVNMQLFDIGRQGNFIFKFQR